MDGVVLLGQQLLQAWALPLSCLVCLQFNSSFCIFLESPTPKVSWVCSLKAYAMPAFSPIAIEPPRNSLVMLETFYAHLPRPSLPNLAIVA